MIYHLIMKLKDLPSFKRPREKLILSGVESLKNFELLAILLRTGYKGKSALDISKRLLQIQDFYDIASLSFRDLSKIKGVGSSRAATLVAAFEISKRIREQNRVPTIDDPTDVVHAVSHIKNKRREHFVGLYLDARQQLIKTHTISIGTLDASIAHPRDVFAPALTYNAASIIVVHNHPSGNPDPSREDILLTKKLQEGGKVLGIDMIDHIIISASGYVSMKEKGLI